MSSWAIRRCSSSSQTEWSPSAGRRARRSGSRPASAFNTGTWAWAPVRSSTTWWRSTASFMTTSLVRELLAGGRRRDRRSHGRVGQVDGRRRLPGGFPGHPQPAQLGLDVVPQAPRQEQVLLRGEDVLHVPHPPLGLLGGGDEAVELLGDRAGVAHRVALVAQELHDLEHGLGLGVDELLVLQGLLVAREAL